MHLTFWQDTFKLEITVYALRLVVKPNRRTRMF